jgi:zinc resistance-associated protein
MERTLLRMLAAATTAAALLSSGFTLTAAAQSDQQPPAAEQPTHAEQVKHWAEVGIDTQLKGMKTSLRLTADQEKNWDPFESAVKAAQEARLAALQKEQAGNLSPMDRNAAQADRLQESQANLEKIVEAAKPLYASLDGAQKQKFIALGRKLVPERGEFAKEIRRLGAGKGD